MLTKGFMPKCLNSNGLKWVAIITMLIDHGAVVLIENRILGGPFHLMAPGTSTDIAMWWKVNIALRFIGRLAFPIFCYQIVEGFLHTGDVKRYGRRLLVFAFISEIPFDLAVFNTWFYPQYQNVYITLFLGLAAIGAVHRYEQEGSLWKQALAFVLCCGLAQFLKADYGAFGVFFMVLLYYCRHRAGMQTTLGCIAMAWEITAPLAFIPIRMYNGQRGSKRWQWFFYIFYPVHLLLLAGMGAVLP